MSAQRIPLIFSSRSPRDLNHDPEPWAGWDSLAGGERRSSGLFGYASHDPRPEYDHVQHNEPNPILLYLREAMTRPGSEGLVLAYVAEEQLYSIREAEQFGAMATYGFDVTLQQLAHARLVLKRLAAPAKDVAL